MRLVRFIHDTSIPNHFIGGALSPLNSNGFEYLFEGGLFSELGLDVAP
jgi:hypothetical protein